jgi:hypothetical protein
MREFQLTIETSDGCRYFNPLLIVCPNPRCKKFTLNLVMKEYQYHDSARSWVAGKVLQEWSLIPPSQAKVFPEYIPKQIRDDYLEACLIKKLSPKASATLSRRCLQGMIRDFWGIKKDRLVEEIAALQGKTDELTWQAIDSVRKIGNIGAHMEKDIDLIVDVDPNEAQKLIDLIEFLMKDWYITRHQREESLKGIVAIKDAKEAIKATK